MQVMKDLMGSDECTKAKALRQVADSMWQEAMQNHRCRVVETAFDVADQDEKNMLAEGFRGRIKVAIESPTGTHVVLNCIEANSVIGAEIVMDEIRDDFPFFAKHRFGCRVLQGLLEHCTHTQVSQMVDEIMLHVRDLITHPFGNFVIQHILKYGTSEDRQGIVRYLVMEIFNLSRHSVASHVVEAAFEHGSPDDKSLLVEVLSSNPAELALLGQSHVGSGVARKMMRVQAGNTFQEDVPRMF